MWEGALRALVCSPAVLSAQLDRLASLTGLDTVDLGIVPFTAPLKIHPANGFWIYDDRLVIAEDWHAELWIDDTDSIAVYQRTWNLLRESAVFGTKAQRVITQAQLRTWPPSGAGRPSADALDEAGLHVRSHDGKHPLPVVVYLDPEGFLREGQFMPYPLEGPQDGDLVCRATAAEALLALVNLLKLQPG